MADSTLENLNSISGASPAGLATTDLMYAFRPGAPDTDWKMTGTELLTFLNDNASSFTNVFKTIAVSGQSDVVADTGTDTLTLAGSGVTITTNAGTDTITFTATAAGLGLGTGDSPQFTAVNIGHASDTTIARVSAGVIAVEGSNVVLASNAADASGINTGTATTTFATPDALAGSYAGTKYASFTWSDPTASLAIGNGQAFIKIPASLNGMNLVSVNAEVATAPSGGTVLIQLRRDRGNADMLSTRISIDDGETGSDTAASAAVIDTGNDDVATNDLIYIDLDAVNAAKGLFVILEFRLP